MDTSFKQVFKYQNLLLSRDLGLMLCPFGGATGRIDTSTPFNSPDFYGLNKGIVIIFFIRSVLIYAGKNPVNQFVSHRIDDQHFVFAFIYFSVVIILHISIVPYCR